MHNEHRIKESNVDKSLHLISLFHPVLPLMHEP